MLQYPGMFVLSITVIHKCPYFEMILDCGLVAEIL